MATAATSHPSHRALRPRSPTSVADRDPGARRAASAIAMMPIVPAQQTRLSTAKKNDIVSVVRTLLPGVVEPSRHCCRTGSIQVVRPNDQTALGTAAQ